MRAEKNVIFYEKQRYHRVRWIVLGIWLIVMSVLMLLLRKHPIETVERLSRIGILTLIVIPTAIVLLLWMCKLETKVNQDGLMVRLFPFHITYRRFYFYDLEQYYPRQYRPILEYGGWGLRSSFNHGMAYNISGNKGLQLILKNGKRLLIGSQDPEKIAEAMDGINPKRKTKTKSSNG